MGPRPLRQARASAEGRDKLDGQIAAAEAEKKALPAIASPDPGAEWLATTLHAGFGLPLTPMIIGNVCIAGLALAPPLSGWLFKFAFVLLGMRRR